MFCRDKQAPIDTVQFEFIPTAQQANEIAEAPEHGAYVTNLYLEGASWDHQKQCLVEPQFMHHTVQMPVMHFKPVLNKTIAPANAYACPTFYAGREALTQYRPYRID